MTDAELRIAIERLVAKDDEIERRLMSQEKRFDRLQEVLQAVFLKTFYIVLTMLGVVLVGFGTVVWQLLRIGGIGG